ncbi:MAG: hypothetical protein IJ565_03855 [Bacilli bacterium]|nr:hypothetical protein [Bacilli bacterium]
MSNEELIQAIEELRNILPQSELDRELISLDEEIRPLEEKIANNDNYREDAEVGNERRKTIYERTIESVQNKLTQAREDVNSSNTRIIEAEKDLAAYEDAIEQTGVELRASDGTQDERFNRILENQRNGRDETASRLENLRSFLAQRTSDVSSDERSLSYYQDRLETLERRMAEEPGVNLNVKMADEDRLQELQTARDSISSRFEYIRENVDADLNDMITGIQNGTYSIEDATRDLTVLYETISNSTTIEQDREAELAKIESQLAENASEIANIQTRLEEDSNYLESNFRGEVYDQRISELEERRDRANGDALRRQLETMRRRVVTLDPATDEAEIADLKARIADQEEALATEYGSDRLEKADRYQNLIDFYTDKRYNVTNSNDLEQIQSLRSELATLDNSSVRAIEIRKQLKDLVDNNAFDYSKYESDQNKLAELLSAKAALENRKQFLSIGVTEKIATILSSLENVNVATSTNEAPVVSNEEVVVPTTDVTIDTPEIEIADNADDLFGEVTNEVDSVKPAEQEDDFDIQVSDDDDFDIKMEGDPTVNANYVYKPDWWYEKYMSGDNPEYIEGVDEKIVPFDVNKKKSNVGEKLAAAALIPVAAYHKASDSLQNKAKGLLGKFKTKLAGMKNGFKDEWKKYLYGLAVAGGVVAALFSLTNDELRDRLASKFGNDANTESMVDAGEENTEDKDKENSDSQAIHDAVTGKATDSTNKKTGTGTSTTSTKTTGTGTSTNTTGTNTTGTNTTGTNTTGTNTTTNPGGTGNGTNTGGTGTSTNTTDEKGTIISQSEEIVGENTNQQVIGQSTVVTGGEKISETTEVVGNEVVNPDGTKTSTGVTNVTDGTGTGVVSDTTEVIDNNVVLPDLGGGVIVSNEEVQNNNTNQQVISENTNTTGGEKVAETVTGGETKTENTNTTVETKTENTATGETKDSTTEVTENNVVLPGGTEKTETETKNVGANLTPGESYITSTEDASYVQNIKLANGNANLTLTEDGGTYTITNTGTTEETVAADQAGGTADEFAGMSEEEKQAILAQRAAELQQATLTNDQLLDLQALLGDSAEVVTNNSGGMHR